MSRKNAHLVAALACTVALSGCKVKELGAHISDTQAKAVDPSWVKAAKSCWPMLTDKGDNYVSVNLGDPIGFRNTFPGFATMTDAQIEAMVPYTVASAPPVDLSLFRNSNTPLLTRQQATGDSASSQDVRELASVSPDTLCATHPGVPAEYR